MGFFCQICWSAPFITFVTLTPDDTPVATAKRLPGESEEERDSAGRLWRTVIIGDQEQRIDMQVIRPYLRAVTHGGELVRVCSLNVQIVDRLMHRKGKKVKMRLHRWNRRQTAVTPACLSISCFRLLWWGTECHHCVCSLLSSWQQLWRLHLHHGEPLPVRI